MDNFKAKAKPKKPGAAEIDMTRFETIWDAYPPRQGANKKEALRQYSARIRQGASHDDIFDGVKRYAEYVRKLNKEPEYIKLPSTFLGRAEHFRLPWSVPVEQARGHHLAQTDTIAETKKLIQSYDRGKLGDRKEMPKLSSIVKVR